MAHANAPLTPEGRRRLIERIILDGRPISHVAAEAGVSRQRLSVWLHRFELLGEAGARVTGGGWPKCCGYTMRWWTQRQIDAGEVTA